MEYRQIGIADKNNVGAVKLLQEQIQKNKELTIERLENATGFVLFSVNGKEIIETTCVTGLPDLARIGLLVEEWRMKAPRMALQLIGKTLDYIKNKGNGDQNE